MLFLGKIIFGGEVFYTGNYTLPLQLKVKKSEFKLVVRKKGIVVKLTIPNYNILIDKK